MTKPIVQSVQFPVSGKELYKIFLSSKRHAEFTGGKVTISPKPGSKFSAFNGMLSGQTLWTLPGKMLVQRWRGTHWPKSDADSILIVQFSDVSGGGRIDLVHVNVPEHDHAGVTGGWKTFYWGPLRKYLKTGKRQKFSHGGM
jgi:activator of HSP90 ATPase